MRDFSTGDVIPAPQKSTDFTQPLKPSEYLKQINLTLIEIKKLKIQLFSGVSFFKIKS